MADKGNEIGMENKGGNTMGGNKGKRILSILMVISMMLSLLPTTAWAASNVSVSDYEGLKSALTSSANGTTVKLTSNIIYKDSIQVSRSLTLDLNGKELKFEGTGEDKKFLATGISFNGSGTFTIKDSVGNGKLTASKTYSSIFANTGSGTLDLVSGTISTDQEMSSAIFNKASGSIKLSGATVSSDKFYAISNQSPSGKLEMTRGDLSSDSSYALVNYGEAAIKGGNISSNTSIAISNLGSDALLDVVGGTIKSTSSYAIANGGNRNKVKIIGGTISSESNIAMVNFNSSILEISSGTVSSNSGMAIANMDGGNMTISAGATIKSTSDTAVYTKGNLTITGGDISSDSGLAMISAAPMGSEVEISGGSLSSVSGYSVANTAGGTMTITGTATLSTESGGVCLLNQGTGKSVINGGTLSANMAELYNLNKGKIEVNGGTYKLAINNNEDGRIIVNGGSIKAIQGTTPINSGGTALVSYPIRLTNGTNPLTNTLIATNELTLTPNTSYGFNGVKTDESGTIYLWLPSTTATANYKSGSIDVSGGISGGKTSVLPNYTGRVTVLLNGQAWDDPSEVLLSTSKEDILGADIIIADGNGPKAGGVYEFSGLKPGDEYFIWGNGTLGLSPSDEELTKDKLTATVNFYDLKVNAGEGISGIFLNARLIQNTDILIQASVKSDYTFEKWANTTGGELVLGTSSGIIIMNGKKDLTAYATLNTYNGSVTLKKDDSNWSDSTKAVTLSTSDTDKNAVGNKTVSTHTAGKYEFSQLSPLITYYVWVGDVNTGQRVTKNSKDILVDYYTVAVATGDNITSVSGGGVYLKGTEITLSAIVNVGDFVFSRWKNTVDSALVSLENPCKFLVNEKVDLTAVGGASRYTASVKLKKDGTDWTTSPRNIVLSTSESELVGTVRGTLSGNSYSFSNLPGAGSYYIWDGDKVIYTGEEISPTGANIELEYFTVTVTPDSNIESVEGAGVYLEGGNVTITAIPKDYYTVTGDGWTDGRFSITSISSVQTISVETKLNTYIGTVTVKKDNIVWTDYGKTITLSTESTNKEVGELTTTGEKGVFTASNLDPTKTYYIWAGDVYTGQVISPSSEASKSATVDYYSVSVTGNNVTVNGGGDYLAGSNVELIATASGGYEFVGWYTGITLISNNTTLTLTDLNEKQELSTEASNLFNAKVLVFGKEGDVKLKDGGTFINSDIETSNFSNLELTKNYNVYVDGQDTGKTVSKSESEVSVYYYTVSLTSEGSGISSISGGGTYLAGSDVTIVAEVGSGYTFGGWGAEDITGITSTITNIDKDYNLTATAYKPYDGSYFNISVGSITISDSTTADKIKMVQVNGDTVDGIDPTDIIAITGSSEANVIEISASSGATLMLDGVDIDEGENHISPLTIKDTSGDVTIILEGENKLTTRKDGRVALRKENTELLTIKSIDGTFKHSLNASSEGNSGVGIGRSVSYPVSNITIDSGTINATGTNSGIGVYKAITSNIIINGGIVTASYIGGRNTLENHSYLNNFTVNNGTVNVVNVPNGNGISRGKDIKIKGGSLSAKLGSELNPTDDSSKAVYKLALKTGLQKTDISSILTIKKVEDTNFKYGTKDIWTDTNGYVYLYLSDGTYTFILDGLPKEITVGSGEETIDFATKTYTVNTPTNITKEGITFNSVVTPNSNIEQGTSVTVNVSLSGIPQKPGTYTLELAGTGIGSVATKSLEVTKNEGINDSKTLSFNMPNSNVSDLALKVIFSETAKHSVSYYNGTALLASESYYKDETYSLLDASNLQKTGYTYGEWGVTDDQKMGTSDVIHNVVWKPNTYKIIFHNNTSTTEQSFTYNGTKTALNGNFTKEGFTLSGWAETPNGPKVYSVNEEVQNLTSVKSGIVHLYALWQGKSHEVSFVSGDGTGTMTNQAYTHGASQELNPNTFIRTGYTFARWKDQYEKFYVNGQELTVSKDIILTAQWNHNSYEVIFNGNGANYGTMGNQSFYYDTAQNLTNNTFTRTGYTFGGWAISANGSKSYDDGVSVENLTETHKGKIVLYAIWTPNNYSVNFNTNAGTGGSMVSQSFTYDVANQLTENFFTKAGYSFNGWNTVTGGTGLSYLDKASVNNLAVNGEVTLYAQWRADTYSLAFNANTGLGHMDNQNFATGDSSFVSANRFVKPGYSFDGWNTKADASGTNYSVGTALKGLDNITSANPILYAKWKANSYTVNFNANGGTGTIVDQSFSYDDSKNLTSNSFTRGSDTFLGWSTSSTGDVATYTNGQSVRNLTTIADGKVTLYAVWKANTYEVNFDANGGSGDMFTQIINRDTKTRLNENNYTRANYGFASWNTNKDGSGTNYTNKHEVKNLAGDVGNSITLYAQWTENVRYNLNGVVRDSGDNLLSNTTVKLMQGSTIVSETKTGIDGSYFFANLKSGNYNIVAIKEGKTVTILASLVSNTIKDIIIPALTTNNSVLVVTNEPNVENIGVMVGGLDALAKDEEADITMTVMVKAEDNGDEEQLAIKGKAGNQVLGAYLDMTVNKGTEPQATIGNVLEIVIPFNFEGKKDLNVYRYHQEKTEGFIKLTERPISSFKDATFYPDSASGMIYVYASKFSTYAVTYTRLSSGGSSSGGGSAGGASSSSTHLVNIDNSGIIGGKVRVDKNMANLGEKVTITVTPHKDYKLCRLSVLDTKGNEIICTDNNKGIYTFNMPSGPVTIKVVFSKDGTFPFVDVAETHWAREAIKWANTKGLFTGTSNTSFGPNIVTTRGMVVTVLWRMENMPRVTQDKIFTDASIDAYYGKAVAWANKNGVVLGYGNNIFGPNDTITREQMAVILHRYAKLKGIDVSKHIKLDKFTDGDKTASYAKTAMEWAVAKNLISGKGENILDPKGNATRAEVALILMRFVEMGN